MGEALAPVARAGRRVAAPLTRAGRRVSRGWAGMALRTRLVLASTALLLAGLIAADVVGLTVLRNYLYSRIDGQVSTYAQTVVRRALAEGRIPPSITAPVDGGTSGPRGTVVPSAYFVGYIPPGGSLTAVATTGNGIPAVSASALPTPGPAANPPFGISVPYSDPFTAGSSLSRHQWRVVTASVPTTSGDVGLVIALSLDDTNNTLARLRAIDVVVSIVLVAILALLDRLIVSRSTRPLRQIESTARAIAGGDLSRRVPEGDPRTEVGSVSIALNTMLSRIEDAFRDREASEKRMRRFVADASHELRTPLTSIRGYAELYRHRAAANPDEVARMMGRIEDEAQRMGALVDDMLMLARLDQRRPLEKAPVDLVVVAADAAHDARALAPGRPVRLEGLGDRGASPGPVVVTGDELRLRQVVSNLVKNALVHTPPECPVTIRVGLRAGGTEGVLEVADRGPGLAPDQVEKVFERFYRADPGRSRDAGGSGLGLSIVAAIVAAHGGRVEVETAPGRGATFRVVLPVSAVEPEPEPFEEPEVTPGGDDAGPAPPPPAEADPPDTRAADPTPAAEPVIARSGRTPPEGR